jgi:oligopeptide/dipeptide ABC transporter ATP-binding protein
LHLLRDLQHRFEMAVLLITHDMGIVAENTHRIMVMYGGQIVEQSATAPLFEQRLHPYTEALLGCVPRLYAEGGGSDTLTSIPGAPPDLANLPPGCRFAPRCPRAQDLCTSALPRLEALPSRRQVACFFPLAATLMAPEPVVRDHEHVSR